MPSLSLTRTSVLILLATWIVQVAVPASYYLDAVNGSDDGDGSREHPWRSFANVLTYYTSEYRPAGWVELKVGDTLYLADGVYNRTLHPGEWQQGREGGGSFVAYFRGLKGADGKRFALKALPGCKPVIDPQGKGIGISIFQSSHWDVESIEIRNAYQRGLSLSESSDLAVRGVHIHDTDGVDNNNIAGLYITDCRNVEIAECMFNDNYDRTCADTGGASTENSCNVVIFGGMRGGDITIHDCYVCNAATVEHRENGGVRAGGGIKYKHASRVPEAFFHVHHNTFVDCSFFAFGSGTANTHFHDNIIVGPAGISSRDFGGVTHQVNQVFENNVIYIDRAAHARSPFELNPTAHWRNAEFPDDPKSIVFKNNIVFDLNPYSNERAVVSIGTYMTDEVYEATINTIRFEGNSYYNPDSTPQFNIAAGFNDRDGYHKGGVYALGQWQETFGCDRTSVRADPLELDGKFAGVPHSQLAPELLKKRGYQKQAERTVRTANP